jgi:hypothetical protein
VLKREPENLERKCFIATFVLMIFMLLGGAVVTKASEGILLFCIVSFYSPFIIMAHCLSLSFC